MLSLQKTLRTRIDDDLAFCVQAILGSLALKELYQSVEKLASKFRPSINIIKADASQYQPKLYM